MGSGYFTFSVFPKYENISSRLECVIYFRFPGRGRGDAFTTITKEENIQQVVIFS